LKHSKIFDLLQELAGIIRYELLQVLAKYRHILMRLVLMDDFNSGILKPVLQNMQAQFRLPAE
jgi:hypothetical protein